MAIILLGKKIPMICTECNTAYYRDTSKDGWPCDFCGSEDIHRTSEQYMHSWIEKVLTFQKELKITI